MGKIDSMGFVNMQEVNRMNPQDQHLSIGIPDGSNNNRRPPVQLGGSPRDMIGISDINATGYSNTSFNAFKGA